MEVLKIATAGSVDDGKSTLIGRLLYDTKSLTKDKILAIEKTSKQKGYDYLDFSLVTDGLVAEREQGITIDVAHIYFSTAKKSYIIADTPGHIEYTRNMITGASTSQAAVILIDARNGIIEQSKRHFFINNLLRIREIVVAINKMDLVGFCQETYENIQKDFQKLMQNRDYKEQKITFIPISALKGDNVVKKSGKMPWYKGETILEHFESLKMKDIFNIGSTRFPIQYIIRPKTDKFHDFRGYVGKVYGGDLSVNDGVVVLPTLNKSKIKDIYFFDTKVKTAVRRSSILVTLADDININRGDMIVKLNNLPKIEKNIKAVVAWMDFKTLQIGDKYILQHGVNKSLAKIEVIHYKIKTDFQGIDDTVNNAKINDIVLISIKLNKPIFCDKFKNHRTNGSFILIDPQSNHTSGAGFIQ